MVGIPKKNCFRCRICKKEIETALDGMCGDCVYLVNVILKTNSSQIKRETIEKLLAKFKADHETWKKSNKLL